MFFANFKTLNQEKINFVKYILSKDNPDSDMLVAIKAVTKDRHVHGQHMTEKKRQAFGYWEWWFFLMLLPQRLQFFHRRVVCVIHHNEQLFPAADECLVFR